MSRSLSTIAADIITHWPNPSVHAMPYLDAMRRLSSINDMYYADSARTVVLYFLSNAGKWRGVDAKRIKAELNAMLKGSGDGITIN